MVRPVNYARFTLAGHAARPNLNGILNAIAGPRKQDYRTLHFERRSPSRPHMESAGSMKEKIRPAGPLAEVGNRTAGCPDTVA